MMLSLRILSRTSGSLPLRPLQLNWRIFKLKLLSGFGAGVGVGPGGGGGGVGGGLGDLGGGLGWEVWLELLSLG